LYQFFGVFNLKKRKNARKFEKIPKFSISFCFQDKESGVRIRIKIKPWIQIRIKAYADPKHWFLFLLDVVLRKPPNDFDTG